MFDPFSKFGIIYIEKKGTKFVQQENKTFS